MIFENCPKLHPSKQISPQDRKGAEKGSSVRSFLDAPGHSKSSKIEKKGVSNIDDFFDPLLVPTLPHFRLPQAPPKQPK